jgi:hypothetical protein
METVALEWMQRVYFFARKKGLAKPAPFLNRISYLQ